MVCKQNLLKIRFFNTFEPVTTFYRDLIPFLVEQGYQVEVVVSRAQYRAGRDVSWAVPGVTVRWMPSFGVQPQNRLGKLIIMLTYILGGALFSLLGPAVDKNVFLTQPPLFSVWGYVLKMLRGQSYYQVLMDIYPDVAVQGRLLSDRAFSTRFLRFLSHLSLKKAERVIVIGRCMRQRVLDMDVAPNRIIFIPNWSDQETVYPIQSRENPLRTQWGWQDKFVVLYSGNIGTSHFFDDLLEVCYRLRHHRQLLFAFIGDGQRRREIEAFKSQHGLENIVLLPFQKQELLAHSLSVADLHFVSLRAEFEGLVVPSKTYGILAAGRPVLYQGPSNSEIARLITEEDIGAVIPLNAPDQLETALLSYLNHPEQLRVQGNRARKLSEIRLSRQAACQRYASALDLTSQPISSLETQHI
jgi:colanic acid biosynthesis glycosyl transferase WcaI